MEKENSMIIKVCEDGALAIFGTNSYSVIAVYFIVNMKLPIFLSLPAKQNKKLLTKYLNCLGYVNVSYNLM